jgi:hypothetical protein
MTITETRSLARTGLAAATPLTGDVPDPPYVDTEPAADISALVERRNALPQLHSAEETE